MKKRISNCIALLLLCGLCRAQTDGFAYQVRLDTVRQAGFYNIEILPPVNAVARTDFSDVRIVNKAGKWVPHLLRQPATELTSATVLKEMPFLTKQVTAAAVTCVVKNSSSELSQVQVTMKNTAVQRVAGISGSYDGSSWFIINDSIQLQPAAVTGSDNTFCSISFPPVSYPYIRITVNNRQTDPVNIIRIAAYTTAGAKPSKNVSASFTENPACSLRQLDSGNISYIRVTQAAAYQFEQLSLQAVGVKFFNRKALLCIPAAGAAHSYSNPGALHYRLTISSNSPLQFAVPQVKAPVFYLLVYNDDNPPLQITSVKTALRQRILTAWLQPDSSYRLLAGHKTVAAPVYDLERQSTILPDSIPVLAAVDLSAIATPGAQEPVVAPKRSNHWLLWGCVGLVLAALLYFSVQLVREVNRRKNSAVEP